MYVNIWVSKPRMQLWKWELSGCRTGNSPVTLSVYFRWGFRCKKLHKWFSLQHPFGHVMKNDTTGKCSTLTRWHELGQRLNITHRLDCLGCCDILEQSQMSYWGLAAWKCERVTGSRHVSPYDCEQTSVLIIIPNLTPNSFLSPSVYPTAFRKFIAAPLISFIFFLCFIFHYLICTVYCFSSSFIG